MRGVLIFAPIALLIAYMVSVFTPDSLEIESEIYPDYAALVSSGLIEKGWVPAFVPKSAYDIRVNHRADALTISLEFNFEPSDIGAIKDACNPVAADEFQCENQDFDVLVKVTDGNFARISSSLSGI